MCVKPLRQVVTATADGALAATALEKYVAELQRETGLRSTVAPTKGRKPDTASEHSGMFDEGMAEELKSLFSKMERNLLLKLCLDDRPVSVELETFIRSLADLSDRLTVAVSEETVSDAPCVRVCLEDGTETGLAFHGVPGGHEFTSFVLGLYNAAGPGQPMTTETKERIRRLREPVDMKILVTLSCNMCPDLVKTAQRIAVENPKITASVYDLQHFEELKNQYRIMSVPCMVINDEQVLFGKKTMEELLDLLEE